MRRLISVRPRKPFTLMGVVVIIAIAYTARGGIRESAWLGVLPMASKPSKQLKRLGSVRAIAIKKVSCSKDLSMDTLPRERKGGKPSDLQTCLCPAHLVQYRDLHLHSRV